jgi:hypothetical protein
MLKRDIRQHSRVPYTGPVRISWEDDQGVVKYTEAKYLDISEAGLRIEAREYIPLRSRISLRADGIKLSGSATVRHVERHDLNAS